MIFTLKDNIIHKWAKNVKPLRVEPDAVSVSQCEFLEARCHRVPELYHEDHQRRACGEMVASQSELLKCPACKWIGMVLFVRDYVVVRTGRITLGGGFAMLRCRNE